MTALDYKQVTNVHDLLVDDCCKDLCVAGCLDVELAVVVAVVHAVLEHTAADEYNFVARRDNYWSFDCMTLWAADWVQELNCNLIDGKLAEKHGYDYLLEQLKFHPCTMMDFLQEALHSYFY